MMSDLSIKNIKNKFFGLNLHLLFKALSSLGFSYKKLYINNNKLYFNNDEYQKIISFIEMSFILESNLKDKIFIDIRKLKMLKGYKGSRHNYSLPVHGQRTKTNAMTCKKRKINNVKKK